jgi:TonB family protein
MKRFRYFAEIALGVTIVLFPLATIAQDSQLVARLKSAEIAQSLDDPQLKPWHLKMTVQLYDTKGNVSESDTVEEWWAAPDQYRRVFTTPSWTAVQVKNATGYFVSGNSGTSFYLLEQMLTEVVHPVQSTSVAPITPDLIKQKFGKVDLECLMLDPHLKGIPTPPLGLFPTYCLKPGVDSLILVPDLTETIMRTVIGKFQGRYVPVDLNIFTSGVKTATEHIAMLETISDTAGDFDQATGSLLSPDAPVRVSGGTIAGNRHSLMQPIYPESAKQKHISGIVILHAIIGTDGHVHSLKLISAPDQDLAISAIVAVRSWTYSPYRLKGVLVSVETTINVNFALGP